MEIKDYLHLYIGCEVYIQRLDKYGRLIMVSSESSGRGYVRITSPDITGWYEVKLILRPLSDMTERDASDIVSAIPGMVVSDCYSFIQDWIKGKSIMIQFETQVALTNEMRRRGFDVDHLIPAGLAIDKTPLI